MQKKQKQASLTDFFVKNCFHCKYSGRVTGLKRRPGMCAIFVRYRLGIGQRSARSRAAPKNSIEKKQNVCCLYSNEILIFVRITQFK